VPSIADPQLWIARSGPEIEQQLWAFRDKAGRSVTLIPEVTALVKDIYYSGWQQSRPKPVRIFYAQRCYRYERPQPGRYREFTQFGIEIFGPGDYEDEAKALLRRCLDSTNVAYRWDDAAERGLSYYSRQGFEASVPSLGAQQQIAGGGSYQDGCGWAIGVDRLVIARMMNAAPG
jgi:histidyl-tRNA synthetase